MFMTPRQAQTATGPSRSESQGHGDRIDPAPPVGIGLYTSSRQIFGINWGCRPKYVVDPHLAPEAEFRAFPRDKPAQVALEIGVKLPVGVHLVAALGRPLD